MSNPDHIAKLLQGSNAWNAWRQEAPDIIPDLSGALLTTAAGMPRSVLAGPLDLAGANLRSADLSGMALTQVNLYGADLQGAKLRHTALSDTDLTLANLAYADLSGAHLDNCSIAGARLDSTTLHDADLRGGIDATAEQMLGALIDDSTLFPDELHMSEAWRERHEEAGRWDDFEESQNPAHPLLALTPHDILQIPADASADEIRSAYRALAKQYHPDVNPGDEQAESHFKDIGEAYRLALGAVEKRTDRRTAWSLKGWRSAAAIFAACLILPSIALLMFREAPNDDGQPSADVIVTAKTRSSPDDAPATASRDDSGLSAGPATHSPPHPGQTASPGDVPEPTLDKSETGTAVANMEVPVTRTQSEAEPWRKHWRIVRRSLGMQAIENAVYSAPILQSATGPSVRIRIVMTSPGRSGTAARSVPSRPDIAPEASFFSHRLASLIDDFKRHQADLRAWEVARKSNTIADYRGYISNYGNGQHVKTAYLRLEALQAEIAKAEEDTDAWDVATRKATIASLQDYRRDFPNGRYAGIAADRIAELRKMEIARQDALRIREEESWAHAARQNTRVALLAYLNAYPTGKYAGAARDTLESIATRTAIAEPPEPESEAAPASTPPKKRPLASSRRANRFPSSDEPFVDAGPLTR